MPNGKINQTDFIEKEIEGETIYGKYSYIRYMQ
jgi:hypothetical protein